MSLYPQIKNLLRVSTMSIVLMLLPLACCEVNSPIIFHQKSPWLSLTHFLGPLKSSAIVEDVDDDNSRLNQETGTSEGGGGGSSCVDGSCDTDGGHASDASKRGRANYLQTERALKAQTQAEVSAKALAEAREQWPANVRKFSAQTVHQYHKEALNGKGDFKESYQGHHAKVEWLLQDKERRKRFMDFVDLNGNKKGAKNMSAKTELYDFVNFTLFRVS